ncbi:MAG: ClpXP protease specificity-enhancing factor SspB [Pseudomonadota bacterium]
MGKKLIDYSILVDDAMHFIVKKSLQIFAENSFHGDHHFFISFITKYPGVVISEKLHNKYPYEMTIVLQHQFEDLIVREDSFSVSLSFDNQKEKIIIPFASLTAFADPSVKFGLQFRHIEENQTDAPIKLEKKAKTKISSKTSKPAAESKNSNVISLDFTNKKRL